MLDKFKKILASLERENKKDPEKEEIEEPETKAQEENIDEDEGEVAGSITYYFRKDDPSTYMDLHLADYDVETISKFSEIVASFSSIRFQLETLAMIKGCFEGTEDEHIFDEIVVEMIKHTEEEASILEKINKGNKLEEEKPWIKPSDLIK